MRVFTQEKLAEVLKLHRLWKVGSGGSRANLSWANLSGANLSRADLSEADLSEADLSWADLSGADLSWADLSWANPLVLSQLSTTPAGEIVGWKKCASAVVVKLLIPATARRSNATGRKCRAERAVVLAVFGAEEGRSTFDSSTTYRVGNTVKADSWDENRFNECSHGIHFFLTREEAEAYG